MARPVAAESGSGTTSMRLTGISATPLSDSRVDVYEHRGQNTPERDQNSAIGVDGIKVWLGASPW
jgi:hypothetical protein